jgi:prephenate dehydratase
MQAPIEIPTVAIQGRAGSFHDEVAQRYFGNDTILLSCDNFADVFSALDDNRADYGICAVENSLAGSINEVYDLLLSSPVTIIGEHYLPVRQCLVGLPGTKFQHITEIYSHPVALAQCRKYLDTHLPDAKRLEHHDTAGSVELIKSMQRPDAAAIASHRAAKLHNMNVIAQDIQDEKSNATRFLILGMSQASPRATGTKTSLVLRTSHQPGALYHALGAFAKVSVNLTKLQSRPIPDKPWSYMFYIDVDAGAQDPALQDALSELAKQRCDYTVLGSYPAAKAK